MKGHIWDMLKDLKAFCFKRNVIDLAVAVIFGLIQIHH